MTKRFPVDMKLEIKVLRLRVESLQGQLDMLTVQLDTILKALQEAGMSGASHADNG
ncbi:hypothetical protein [uncultured Mediterranean phage uvDeep-CGR2-AD3-C76]|nr:hypothetical protein [uncultured Mediterranean phage uvDeep-CGR2-AD3-C76]